MLATVEINHDQHISFTQSRLTDAVSVILSELLSYEHPPKAGGPFFIRYQPWVNAIIAPKDTKQLTANQAWTSSIPPEAKAAL